MEINHHRFFLVAHTGRLHGGLRFLVVMDFARHLLLQFLGIHHQRSDNLVILHHSIEQGILLKEVVLAEGVELVKLHCVNAELRINSRFEHKRFATLVG